MGYADLIEKIKLLPRDKQTEVFAFVDALMTQLASKRNSDMGDWSETDFKEMSIAELSGAPGQLGLFDLDRQILQDNRATSVARARQRGGLKSASPGCRLKSAYPGVRPESRVRSGNPRGLDERMTKAPG
ncbi:MULTISPECIES: hypothetical protein [unclassified Thiocapsa]|uniref:hypothetical protein n=1 Tax=unclassified Thiocapsa TaxID=2641286 RepID=UPI0035AE5B7B